MKLILIRHGETQYNKDGVRQGHLDIDLDSEGIDQAKEAAVQLENIPFDLVISSDLKRAKHTTQIILDSLNSDLVATTSDKLREINMGNWQGKAYDDTPEEDLAFTDVIGETGESHQDLYERIKSAVNKMLTNAPDKNILLISHSGPIRAILRMLDGDIDSHPIIPNATPIEVEISQPLSIPKERISQ